MRGVQLLALAFLFAAACAEESSYHEDLLIAVPADYRGAVTALDQDLRILEYEERDTPSAAAEIVASFSDTLAGRRFVGDWLIDSPVLAVRLDLVDEELLPGESGAFHDWRKLADEGLAVVMTPAMQVRIGATGPAMVTERDPLRMLARGDAPAALLDASAQARFFRLQTRVRDHIALFDPGLPSRALRLFSRKSDGAALARAKKLYQGRGRLDYAGFTPAR